MFIITRLPRLRASALAILAVLTVMFGLSACGTANAAPPAPSATDMMTPSVSDAIQRSVVIEVITWSIDMLDFGPTMSMPSARHAQLQSMCSGVIVSPNGDVLTAGHCFDEDMAKQALVRQLNSKGGPTISMPGVPNAMPGSGQPLTASDLPQPTLRIQVIQPDAPDGAPFTKATDAHLTEVRPFERGDYALINVPSVNNTPSLPVANGEPPVGKPMISVGYAGWSAQDALMPNAPISSDITADPYADNPGQMAKDIESSRLHPSFKFGTIGGEQYLMGTRYNETDAALTPGMSGGPALVNDGDTWKIAGTNSYTHDMQPFNFVTSTDGLNSFLHANGLPNAEAADATQAPATTPDNHQAATGQDPNAITSANISFGLLGLFLGVVAALVIMILIRRKRTKALGTSETKEASSTVKPTEDTANDTSDHPAADDNSNEETQKLPVITKHHRAEDPETD